MMSSVLQLKNQGPIYMMGLGHGATHWIAGILYMLLPVLREDLGMTYTQAGTLAAIFHVSSFAANFGSGALVDITGRKVLLQIVALALGALALFGLGTSSAYLVIGLMVVVIGATNNLWHPPAIAFISARYPDHRGYALSIHATGASVADMIAPVAAGALLVHLTWQQTAMVSTAPVAIVIVMFAVILLSGDRVERAQRGSNQDFRTYLSGLLSMVKNRAILGLSLAAAFRSMAQNGLLVFLPLYLADVLKVNTVVMGTALMAMHLAGVVVTPLAGTWSDRVGRRPVVLAGLGASTVTIIGLTFVASTTAFIVGVSILGFVLYAVRPVIHSWMMDIAPDDMRGSATSLLFGTQSLLSIGMPIIGGVIADQYGLTAVFYLIGATMLIANLTTITLPDSKRTVTA
ncbi:MAG: MFS transporter [Chromatiales bacterium]|jgi:MFS family permease|nr:MFS transporter [Chromatiales bacterium]